MVNCHGPAPAASVALLSDPVILVSHTMTRLTRRTLLLGTAALPFASQVLAGK